MSNETTTIDRGSATIGLVTVLVANCLYLAGLHAILDPMMSMDPFYIEMAEQPLSSIVAGDPGWGLLYAIWLKPFVAVLGDPLEVYRANLLVLSFAVTSVIYLYLLQLTRRASIAVGAALFFLICDFNVPLYSKVSGFALMVVLAGLALSELFADAARRMSMVAAGVLVASYARPELYPPALCLSIAAVYLGSRQPGRANLSWPLAGVALIAVLAISLGTPVFSPHHSSERLWMALREHFAWNWSLWHDERRSFLSIWQHEFGDAQTLLQALLRNPGAIIHHLATNFLGTATFLFTGAFAHYPLLAPGTHPLLVRAETMLVAAGACGAVLTVSARADLRKQLADRYAHALFSYAVVAVFCVASATIVYPAPYYLTIPGVLMMIAGTLAASVLIPATAGLSLRARLLAGLICLIAIPRPFILPSDYVVPGSPFKARVIVARTVSDTVDFIRALSLPKPIQVLTLNDGIGTMLGAGFEEIKIWEKGVVSLEDYVRDKQIDLIVSLEPGRDSFAVDDPYWVLLHRSPDAVGFVRLIVPNQDSVRVYARAGLLPAQE